MRGRGGGRQPPAWPEVHPTGHCSASHQEAQVADAPGQGAWSWGQVLGRKGGQTPTGSGPSLLLVWPPRLNINAALEHAGPHKPCSAVRETEAGRVGSRMRVRNRQRVMQVNPERPGASKWRAAPRPPGKTQASRGPGTASSTPLPIKPRLEPGAPVTGPQSTSGLQPACSAPEPQPRLGTEGPSSLSTAAPLAHEGTRQALLYSRPRDMARSSSSAVPPKPRSLPAGPWGSSTPGGTSRPCLAWPPELCSPPQLSSAPLRQGAPPFLHGEHRMSLQVLMTETDHCLSAYPHLPSPSLHLPPVPSTLVCAQPLGAEPVAVHGALWMPPFFQNPTPCLLGWPLSPPHHHSAQAALPQLLSWALARGLLSSGSYVLCTIPCCPGPRSPYLCW